MTADNRVTPDLEAVVAEVLAAHDWRWATRDSTAGDGVRIACIEPSCEWFAERLDPDDDVWTAHRAHVAAEVTNALTSALPADPLEPWGPFEMGGFEGCTDQNPDYCACATNAQPTCRICNQEIEPGEQAWARQWPCYDTLPLDHDDQEWDIVSWHDECPDPAALSALTPDPAEEVAK